jgi:hypothetical protein
MSLPHTDALVITLQVANHIIHKIFVDNGSSADILYWSAFMHMDISRDKIVPARYPLIGFAGPTNRLYRTPGNNRGPPEIEDHNG